MSLAVGLGWVAEVRARVRACAWCICCMLACRSSAEGGGRSMYVHTTQTGIHSSSIIVPPRATNEHNL